MTTMERLLLLVIGSCLLLCSRARAVSIEPDSADRNYQVFVERNPFSLKPLPPPPTNAPPPAAPKDEVLLTGITSIGGPRAYFMSKTPQGKTPEFYSLGPDEKKNGLEVLEIDTQGRSVRVRQAGAEAVMTFVSNGVKPPATPTAPTTPAGVQTPGAPAVPGAVGVPGANLLNPGGNPGAPAVTPPGAPGAGRIRTIPSRTGRTPTMEGAGTAGMIPPPAPPARPDPNAAVQDVLMMELQKRANPNVSFPPTPMPQ